MVLVRFTDAQLPLGIPSTEPTETARKPYLHWTIEAAFECVDMD
jgi:hypothetical protein